MTEVDARTIGVPQGLEGATVVVTGAARGIGAAMAGRAGAAGARVVIADIAAEAEQTVADLRDAGAEVTYVRTDLTEEAAIRELMGSAAATYGGIDVVLNNAGVSDAMLTTELGVEHLPLEVWDRVFAVNVRAPFLTTRHALPYLRRSYRAAIVNVGSIGSFVAFPHTVAYGASKGAVPLLTKNLALELADDGIRVNAVCPAVTETPMTQHYFEAQGDADAMREQFAATHLVPRLGQPEDIANVALFLASPATSFVNGAVWLVDGGQLAWRGSRTPGQEGSHG